jgi:RecB family exonuclease
MRMLSPSSINTFLKCPRKYFYHYIAELPTKPSIHLLRGNIVHKVLEDLFDRKYSLRDNFKEELMSAAMVLLESHWDLSSLEDFPKDKEEIFFKESQQMIRNFIDRFTMQMQITLDSGKAQNFGHAFNLLRPKFREHYYKSDALNVHGYIDSIEQDFDGHVTLIDYKTSSKYKNLLTEDYKRQLAIYALLYKLEEGKLPANVGINYLKYGEIFYVHVTPSLLSWANHEIEKVKSGIVSKDIGAYCMNESKLCNWCDFYDYCFKGKELQKEIK